MRASTGYTVARVAAVVLALLGLAAAYNTAFVVAHAVRSGGGTGSAIAGAASVVVTVALVYAAARVWRRGSGPS